MMAVQDMLRKKRDGLEHTVNEIESFIKGVTSGSIPDYQVAAWLMAVYLQGMSAHETAALTAAMAASGECLDLSSIPGVKVDKHSTGGVGDKTTLVLAPLVAAAGVPVAKMAGRALGHTGGTIDKLESFPGMQVIFPHERFVAQVAEIGLAVVGQTSTLAPADRRLYALRDVTATVESIPLIAASVMSKKLAAGADAFVLDVKVGRGAFCKDVRTGRQLANTMVDIAHYHDRRAVALITDMSQPLGRTVGNALEVREALATLQGAGPSDLRHLCLTLGAEMMGLAQKATDHQTARRQLEKLLASGAALSKLEEMVTAQGGDAEAIYDTDRLPRAPVQYKVIASQNGFITAVDALEVARAAMQLGAGRASKDDHIDLAVGISNMSKVGEPVTCDNCLAVIHAQSQKQAKEVAPAVASAFRIQEQPPDQHPLVIDRIPNS